MKMKQSHIKAILPINETENAKNLSGEKELVSCYKIIDKISEKQVLVCKVWASKNGQTLYSSVWFDSKKDKRWFGGHGTAGGWGYDKESHSIGDALESAGIELRGTPYSNHTLDFKKKCSIRGTGCHEKALMAVAYACGYNNCIFVGV